MAARPIVAVVPFGARAGDPRAGAWARQIARRLVARFAADPAMELREVFLVTMADEGDRGQLVVGSTPDVALAASYGESLGCTHALLGAYSEEAGSRNLEIALVDVVGKCEVARETLAFPAGRLQESEGDVAAWLGAGLGLRVDAAGPAAATEPAYAALLEGLDEELTATLLGSGNPPAALAAASRARERFQGALRADPECAAAEERLLVAAAESLERGDEADQIGSLEELITILPRSWRAHYLLGELRRATGEASGAIVAFEHAHALHPLGDADVVRLADLYLRAGSPAPAVAHLRRIARGSEAPTVRLALARALIARGASDDAATHLEALLATERAAAIASEARRLLFRIREPALERELERAGQSAVAGDVATLDDAAAVFARIVAAQPELWEAHFGLGLVAMQRGDPAAAARAFHRALEIHPEQPDVLELLARTQAPT